MNLDSLISQTDTDEASTREVYIYTRTQPSTSNDVEFIQQEIEKIKTNQRIKNTYIKEIPSCISISKQSELTKKYKEYREWARNEGLNLSPFFVEREINSEFTQQNDKVIIPPMVFLSSHKEKEIEFIAPTRFGGDIFTIWDFLDALKQGR